MSLLGEGHALPRTEHGLKTNERLAHAHESPVSRLLSDILVLIFAFLVEADPTTSSAGEGFGPPQVRLGWITVTHVCSFWRQVALDHRTLWTHHRFDLSLEWTAEMLRRAGDAPLELTLSEQFVPFPPSKGDAPTVISQLLHRVSALTIEERAVTLPVLDSLTSPAPLLDTLSITSSQLALLPQSLISANAPKLRDLYLRNVLPAWTTAIFTGLKRLCVVLDRHMDASHVPTYPELFDTLHSMPHLEVLMLRGCLPLGPFPHFLGDRMIQVPNLQHLFLAGHTFGCHQILKHLIFPREAVVSVTCLTDDLTGQDCCDILPLLISRLPRPSLGTLDVSWKDRFDRAFNISGDSTWHEDEDAKQPRFLSRRGNRLSVRFNFKFLLWSAEQKVRMLKAVCAALPTDELRVLTGNLDLGNNAWSEVLGGHQRLQHIRVGSLSTLRSFVPFLSQEGVYPDLKSLTLFDVDLGAKPDDTIALMKQLNSSRPPKLSTVIIDACRLRRELVLAMKAAAPDLEIRWDGNEDESPEDFDKLEYRISQYCSSFTY
ncbi:hypothetical protein EDB89DRAFT_730392 [Lactarius sanguifluus]|nr:hypothetical protein EDB89DRAFT_730392 [Lactarius sanguifluus]